ncbi:MAG TPA: aminoglycoside phosphotransferase family protein [Candidatus Limnocylindrales bacterium]
MTIPERRASVVLVARDGTVLGRLPEFPVATPWWQEAQPVVQGVRDRFGLEIVVLRLLDTELPHPQGGGVTYLAEPRGHVPPDIALRLVPFDGHLDEQPLRLGWATPGGPAADLAWAEGVLRRRRLERVGHAEQLRSWNLSSIWRLPLREGAAWLKVVPPFFAHEGDILRRLQGGPVPRLLGHDRGRILLADIAGSDRYDAGLDELLEMVSLLVDLQVAWIGRTDQLRSIDLPDWRGPRLTSGIADVVERQGATLPAAVLAGLDAFVAGLPARFDAIAACDLPDTIVHGDFHPGNVRGGGDLRGDEGAGAGNHALTLLDWGDCGIGNPLLDLSAFLDRAPAEARATVRDHWTDAWRRHRPGSDPVEAMRLVAPVAAARQALIYQHFLDHIEPTERRYHDADVPEWLARTAALVAGTTPSGAG